MRIQPERPTGSLWDIYAASYRKERSRQHLPPALGRAGRLWANPPLRRSRPYFTRL
jgi:hypothetical protein